MLMHLHAILFKRKCGFQTLNIISMSMWIAHVFIHTHWCSKVVSSHLRETLPYLIRSSWHHHTILYLHLLVVAQW